MGFATPSDVFRDPIDPGRAARLDSESFLRLNHEIYFFSDLGSRLRFTTAPWKWCGSVTDPVSHERFAPDAGSPALAYRDQLYYFRADSTKATFLEMPEMYAEPGPMKKAEPENPAAAESGAPAEAPAEVAAGTGG
ncbi:MAG: hypothetical protein R3B81_04140 [bacterium]